MCQDDFPVITCCECGKVERASYVKPVKDQMVAKQLCYNCNFWHREDERLQQASPESLCIIGSTIYSPGNRTSGSFRGMAGRRFDIEFISGPLKGKRCTTFDLWCGSRMPEWLAKKHPDTAIFLGGAEQAQVGEITCWNPSDPKAPEYPLPRAIGFRSASRAY